MSICVFVIHYIFNIQFISTLYARNRMKLCVDIYNLTRTVDTSLLSGLAETRWIDKFIRKTFDQR